MKRSEDTVDNRRAYTAPRITTLSAREVIERVGPAQGLASNGTANGPGETLGRGHGRGHGRGR